MLKLTHHYLLSCEYFFLSLYQFLHHFFVRDTIACCFNSWKIDWFFLSMPQLSFLPLQVVLYLLKWLQLQVLLIRVKNILFSRSQSPSSFLLCFQIMFLFGLNGLRVYVVVSKYNFLTERSDNSAIILGGRQLCDILTLLKRVPSTTSQGDAAPNDFENRRKRICPPERYRPSMKILVIN